jgi:hypothetical protein
MVANLLREDWANLNSAELRLLLDARIGHPGQYDGKSTNKIFLPLAGSSCRVGLTFRGKDIVAIEPGPGFDADEWKRISEEIDTSIKAGPIKTGREYSFSSFRVSGSWRGRNSHVQILPPPDDAPDAEEEMAEHPFILEFPIMESNLWPITNHRRIREHRKITLLLNVLLAGHTTFQAQRAEHFWASIRYTDRHEIKWVQRFYFAKLGSAVIDDLSPIATELLEEMEPEEYYSRVGHDGRGLRVPADLDDSISLYQNLPSTQRDQFDRAAFWLEMARANGMLRCLLRSLLLLQPLNR